MYYQQDQAQVAKYCDSPKALVDVVTMVLLSIRQPWYAIGDQLEDVRRNKGDSRYLFGFKRKGYLHAVEHSKRLFDHVKGHRKGEVSTRCLMREFMKVPGLGLAKAGFLVQLVAGEAGCMDSHNIKRFGLDKQFFVIPKRVNEADQIEVIDGKIDAYLALCEASGGTAYLWDSWCDLIAAKAPTKYADGAEVSRLHWAFLTDDLR